ncbi:MAG: fructose-1,6-bisphosphatase [Zetaproteobacteria bacterium]|nr:MAG: fructose-1,6-bisphosphatase [Zetaproteobacteria bacterium]
MPISLNTLAGKGSHGAAMMPIIQGVGRAAVEISYLLRGAVFRDALGAAGGENVQGEAQQKIDVLSDEIFLDEMRATGHVCAVGSEERASLEVIGEYADADWIVLVDPLDGSSNLDIDGPVGTIFSVVRRSGHAGPPQEGDALRPGREVAAAGYVLYGPATMLVCSVGAGVDGFTWHPNDGRFELSHPDIRIPSGGGYYSVNESNAEKWLDRMGERLARMKRETGLGMRYVGSMVADIHRTLLKGGVFLYPADERNRNGKLRLLYEAIPMAFLVEQAGGRAMSGPGRPILEIEPEALHQRVPVFLGAQAAVDALLRD